MAHKYLKEEDTFSTSQNGAVPKPTAAEETAGKYLKANGTWGTPSGGGGGGSSTLAGLDDVALSSPSNGQVLKYNGTNAKWENANESGGSSHAYSTTEKVIGTWMGKPLYEKTYSDVTPNANSVGISDIDSTKIVHIAFGRLYFQNSAIQLGAYLNASYNSGWYQDFYSGGALILFYSNDYKNGNYEVTVQYTKTTD